MRALVICLLLCARAAFADTPQVTTDVLLRALEQRDAALRYELEHAADLAVESRAAEQRAFDEEHRKLVAADRADADAYKTDVNHAHAVANRKTAVVLAVIAAGLGGAGYGMWHWAEAGKAEILEGGYLTSMDIKSTADSVKVREQVAIGAFAASALFTVIAIGVAW